MNSGSVLAGTDEIGHQEERYAHDPRGGRDVAHEIVAEIVVEGRIDGRRHTDEKQRVAVGGRVDDDLGRDIGGGTRPVLDNELLAGPLRKPVPHQARDDVIAAGRGEPDDPAHRSDRIALGPGDARQRRKRRSARGETQEFPAGRFHGLPPGGDTAMRPDAQQCLER